MLKCLDGNATDFELKEAWDWVHESESNKAFFEAIKELWLLNAVNKPVETTIVNQSWERIQKKITPVSEFKNNKKRLPALGVFNISMSWGRLVAAILFAFLLGGTASIFIIQQIKSFSRESYFTVEAPRGAKSRITLTDGSQVILNAGSKIRYPRSFNQNNRNLYLEGEGYFVVARNENLKFRVYTAGLVVEALGTEFNVKAYPEEGMVETTLVKGSVSINREGNNQNTQPIVLLPNQKASFFTNAISVESTAPAEKQKSPQLANIVTTPARIRIENNINTEVSTSWKEKRWIFERESLGALAIKLERHYDVKIEFETQEIRDFHLTGTLEEESIEQVLLALQLTLPINFDIRHNKVYLTINQSKIRNYKQLLKNKNN